MLQQINLRIASLAYQLEFDLFLLETRREQLLAELSKLLDMREKYEQTTNRLQEKPSDQ